MLVDEYQDLSLSRYNLLRALRESKDYKLFCVGDDW
ncbi:MAG: UvrD-helicase domain-containing protein [Candidatus Methanomethylophilaceae archaeon]|nr:UvrD-helicase domain-containing protein [Candidatus Methanomethylophilaceae archaeon]